MPLPFIPPPASGKQRQGNEEITEAIANQAKNAKTENERL